MNITRPRGSSVEKLDEHVYNSIRLILFGHKSLKKINIMFESSNTRNYLQYWDANRSAMGLLKEKGYFVGQMGYNVELKFYSSIRHPFTLPFTPLKQPLKGSDNQEKDDSIWLTRTIQYCQSGKWDME